MGARMGSWARFAYADGADWMADRELRYSVIP